MTAGSYMTWGDFKQRVEAKGVLDEHVVGSISVDPAEDGDVSVELRGPTKNGHTFFDVEDVAQ